MPAPSLLRRSSWPALALLLLLAVCAAASRLWSAQAPSALPELIELPPGIFAYRLPGEVWREGRPAVAPMLRARIERPLLIMRQQVTAAEYQRCVAAEACPATETAVPNYPVVKVSWRDATAYAVWLSRTTGTSFRLPTDQEWAYAAGSRFEDDALAAAAALTDPGQRAVARYDQDADRAAGLAKAPQPTGFYGANEHGLLDVAGNVWEWTDSCFVRTRLDREGEVVSDVVNCGVRLVEGRHRAYVPDFIRDARAGGCSAGTPPSHLGFRLVRADGP
jgi:formylglycine-generating enzyme required for sulfatase activity